MFKDFIEATMIVFLGLIFVGFLIVGGFFIIYGIGEEASKNQIKKTINPNCIKKEEIK